MGIMDGLGSERLAASLLLSFGACSKFVLVLDCGNVLQTVAHLSSKVCCKLSGVILNNVLSYRHETAITSAVNNVIRSPILGTLRASVAQLEQRHLGVVQPNELVDSRELVNSLVLKVYCGCNVSKLAQFMMADGA